MDKAQRLVRELLDQAGVTVGGGEPWDIEVHDKRFYPRVLRDKSLGLGESYMEGWWDCPAVDQFIHRLLSARLQDRVRDSWRLLLAALPSLILNRQSRSKARMAAHRHYDTGNDLFFSFLDEYRQYSCAFFNGSRDLDKAQQDKMRLTLEKLDLARGETLLDIGCGWGGLARYAAENFGARVTGVNISKAQIGFARNHCRELPVKIVEADYREMEGQWDKAVSVGMFEHVGPRNYPAYFKAVDECLADDGVFLLHTIGANETTQASDPWIERYIFPCGKLPSQAQIAEASEDRFVIEDTHNLGPHYDTTLMCWNERFQDAWPKLSGKYSDTFKRMWEYYLLSCAGAFRARNIQVWQMVMTKPGAPQPECRPELG
jgi:cyclopropane-fatty-acyl-phospholipid synthase